MEAEDRLTGRQLASSRFPWWTSGGFGRLFAGQAISVVGTQVTGLALPVTAVFLLGATPVQMGLLGALDNLPYLLFGLFVGIVVDRFRRRRLMVSADLVRALAVGSIPLAALAGCLGFPQLCAVVFVVGASNLVFDVSAQAQMPDLLTADRLMSGNASLQATSSLAMVVGPGIAGQLIAIVGAPVAIAVDAVSYVASALFIRSIREPELPRHDSTESAGSRILAALKLVRSDGRLVGLAGATATAALAANALFAVFVYYLARRYGFQAGSIGLVHMVVGLAGVLGAIVVPALVGRGIRLGIVLATLPVLAGGALCLLPAATLAGPLAVYALLAGSMIFGLGLISFSVLAAGLRQALAPAEARGRVLGTLRFFEWGSMPVGSLIGGLLGGLLGPEAAIEFAGLAFMASALWIVATPLFALERVPPGS